MRMLLYLLLLVFSTTIISGKDVNNEAKKSAEIVKEKSDKKEKTKKKNKISKKLENEKIQFELKKLEMDASLLKEKIFRSKARLSTLHETLVQGKSIQGSKLIVIHLNNLSNFDIKEVIYHLDGKPLYSSVDANGKKEIVLYNSSIIPGNHMLSTIVVLKVSGFSFFSYAKGYTFNIKSNYSFYVEEGKVTSVNVDIYEKGGYFNELVDKPAIVFKAGVVKNLSAKDIVNIKKTKKKNK